MIHDGGKAYEVEFVTLAGDTLGVLTLTANEVRPHIGKGCAACEGGMRQPLINHWNASL